MQLRLFSESALYVGVNQGGTGWGRDVVWPIMRTGISYLVHQNIVIVHMRIGYIVCLLCMPGKYPSDSMGLLNGHNRPYHGYGDHRGSRHVYNNPIWLGSSNSYHAVWRLSGC